jgi:hypothetical protein
VTVTIPIHTVSEANAHTHWRVRQKRAKQQRSTVQVVLRATATPPALPCSVTLTRIAPRALDDDNLAGALKHVRDGVADWLGINDRDARVSWACAQRRGAARQYAVEVAIGPRAEVRVELLDEAPQVKRQRGASKR